MDRYGMLMIAVLLCGTCSLLQSGCGGGTAAAQVAGGNAQPEDAALLPLADQSVADSEQVQQETDDTELTQPVGDLTEDGAVEEDAGEQAQSDSGMQTEDGSEALAPLTIEDWYLQEYGYLPQDSGVQADSGMDEEETVLDPLLLSGKNGTKITVDGSYRYISSSGLPDHEIGNNGNVMTEQDWQFRVPLDPVANSSATPYYLPDAFGVAINGVPFDPFANEFWNNDRFSGWQLEPMPDGLGLDFSHGHVQPGGAYHYHGLPWGTLTELDGSAMGLIGFAADGFPVYALYGYADTWDAGSAVVELQSSYRLRAGMRGDGPGGIYDGTYIEDYEYVEGLGQLDECNGRYGVTPEFPEGTYYYVITQDYPYIPRMFRGTPDASFQKQKGASRAASGIRHQH
ncbi:YHYH protein [bacterium]|nr:YHYH protein [bacterium]